MVSALQGVLLIFPGHGYITTKKDVDFTNPCLEVVGYPYCQISAAHAMRRRPQLILGNMFLEISYVPRQCRINSKRYVSILIFSYLCLFSLGLLYVCWYLFSHCKDTKSDRYKRKGKRNFHFLLYPQPFSSFSSFGFALCRHLPVAGLAVADTAEEVQALLFVHILDCCTCRHSSPSA